MGVCYSITFILKVQAAGVGTIKSMYDRDIIYITSNLAFQHYQINILKMYICVHWISTERLKNNNILLWKFQRSFQKLLCYITFGIWTKNAIFSHEKLTGFPALLQHIVPAKVKGRKIYSIGNHNIFSTACGYS